MQITVSTAFLFLADWMSPIFRQPRHLLVACLHLASRVPFGFQADRYPRLAPSAQKSRKSGFETAA